MFRSALLALKPTRWQPTVIDSAVQLASSHGLELVVCTVLDAERLAPAEAVPMGASAFKRHRDEKLMQEAKVSAENAVAACRDQCTRHSVRCQGTIREGDTIDEIAQLVHEHDVLLLGHNAGNEVRDEGLLHQYFKRGSRPVVLFPKQESAGQNKDIVIAFDASLQSSRTLASFAYSGFATGSTVHVVALQDDLKTATELSEQACRFLRHHGVVANPKGEQLKGSPAEALLRKCLQLSAGMLVLGAFGQGVVRDFLFGSVTREILRNHRLPVFLSH